jgi:hypothetical protein
VRYRRASLTLYSNVIHSHVTNYLRYTICTQQVVIESCEGLSLKQSIADMLPYYVVFLMLLSTYTICTVCSYNMQQQVVIESCEGLSLRGLHNGKQVPPRPYVHYHLLGYQVLACMHYHCYLYKYCVSNY